MEFVATLSSVKIGFCSFLAWHQMYIVFNLFLLSNEIALLGVFLEYKPLHLQEFISKGSLGIFVFSCVFSSSCLGWDQ
jgi:hypothetical protein